MSTKNQLVDFRAIREAVTIEAVLGHYGLQEKMKRNGDNLSGCCPIHKGTNPTQFRVSVSKNVWNCFSECKRGGNVVDFIACMEDVSPFAAAQKAIEWFKLDPERVYTKSERSPEKTKKSSPAVSEPAAPPKPAEKPVPQVETKPSSDAPNPPLKFRLDKLQRDHPYLLDRGLTLETIVDFGVGFCAKGMMSGRIAIPIHNVDGEVVAYTGRWPGEPPVGTPKYKLPPGFRKSLELFNLDRVVKEPAEKPLVIVEGFFDAMLLHQRACRKVVALMGSTLSVGQEELLRRNKHQYDRIYIMLGEDAAGRAARETIALRLGALAFVKFHTFEEEGHQPDVLTADELSALFP